MILISTLKNFADTLARLITTGSTTKGGGITVMFPDALSFDGLNPMLAKDLSNAEQEVISLLRENQKLRDELDAVHVQLRSK